MTKVHMTIDEGKPDKRGHIGFWLDWEDKERKHGQRFFADPYKHMKLIQERGDVLIVNGKTQ